MSEITSAAYKSMHYMIELPCDFGDTVYILTDNSEIKEHKVYGFVLRYNGVAFEVEGVDGYCYLGKNAFLTYSDALGEQLINKLDLRREHNNGNIRP